MIRVALLSLLAGYSGAVVPGPLFALTVQQALLIGWSAGLWLILGHLCGEGALLLLLRAGLGRWLQRPAVVRGIGVIGGAVLLYFAWGMITLALAGTLAGPAGSQSARMSIGMLVLQGLLLSIFNPYWGLWWATAGIGLIGHQVERHGPQAWIAFFVGHSLADLSWYVGISLLVALAGSMLNASVHRGMILVCGVMIGVLGVLFVARPWLERLRRPAPVIDLP